MRGGTLFLWHCGDAAPYGLRRRETNPWLLINFEKTPGVEWAQNK